MPTSRAEQIFSRYAASLKGFISKQLSSDSESEDILHDLFYRFIITDGEEESIEHVSSWLYRVARNLIIDRSRKKSEEQLPDSEIEAETPFANLLFNEGETPETKLFNTIIREETTNALAELPKEQRQVFELHELQGFSFKEISDATSTPINTLISQKRYAVLHLRTRLKELYEAI